MFVYLFFNCVCGLFVGVSPQILQRKNITHPWRRALVVPGEIERGCGRGMAWRQAGVQRLGKQGEVHLPGHGQGQGARKIPVVRAGATLQLRRARVRGDMNRKGCLQSFWFGYIVQQKEQGERSVLVRVCMSEWVCEGGLALCVFMMKHVQRAVVTGGNLRGWGNSFIGGGRGNMHTNFYEPLNYEARVSWSTVILLWQLVDLMYSWQ